jgi:hypothetical protein
MFSKLAMKLVLAIAPVSLLLVASFGVQSVHAEDKHPAIPGKYDCQLRFSALETQRMEQIRTVDAKRLPFDYPARNLVRMMGNLASRLFPADFSAIRNAHDKTDASLAFRRVTCRSVVSGDPEDASLCKSGSTITQDPARLSTALTVKVNKKESEKALDPKHPEKIVKFATVEAWLGHDEGKSGDRRLTVTGCVTFEKNQDPRKSKKGSKSGKKNEPYCHTVRLTEGAPELKKMDADSLAAQLAGLPPPPTAEQNCVASNRFIWRHMDKRTRGRCRRWLPSCTGELSSVSEGAESESADGGDGKEADSADGSDDLHGYGTENSSGTAHEVSP